VSVTVYSASLKCVCGTVECECELSLTVYSESVRGFSDSVQCECEVFH